MTMSGSDGDAGSGPARNAPRSVHATPWVVASRAAGVRREVVSLAGHDAELVVDDLGVVELRPHPGGVRG